MSNKRSMKNDQNPATAHHTITTARPRQHPLIYSGAGPIHPVHGPLPSPATEAIAPKGFTFSPFWRGVICNLLDPWFNHGVCHINSILYHYFQLWLFHELVVWENLNSICDTSVSHVNLWTLGFIHILLQMERQTFMFLLERFVYQCHDDDEYAYEKKILGVMYQGMLETWHITRVVAAAAAVWVMSNVS